MLCADANVNPCPLTIVQGPCPSFVFHPKKFSYFLPDFFIRSLRINFSDDEGFLVGSTGLVLPLLLLLLSVLSRGLTSAGVLGNGLSIAIVISGRGFSLVVPGLGLSMILVGMFFSTMALSPADLYSGQLRHELFVLISPVWRAHAYRLCLGAVGFGE